MRRIQWVECNSIISKSYFVVVVVFFFVRLLFLFDIINFAGTFHILKRSFTILGRIIPIICKNCQEIDWFPIVVVVFVFFFHWIWIEKRRKSFVIEVFLYIAFRIIAGHISNDLMLIEFMMQIILGSENTDYHMSFGKPHFWIVCSKIDMNLVWRVGNGWCRMLLLQFIRLDKHKQFNPFKN